MRKLTLFLAAGAALAAGGVAYSPAPQARPPLSRAAGEQPSAKALARLDANHDGKLDPKDRADRQKARFDRIDANHDGSVSYAEFSAMHARQEGARAELGHRGGHRMAARGFGRRGFQGAPGGMIRLTDADKDGAITKAEFQAAALARFERLDTDKDGTVTRAEAKAARDSMRQRWQVRREAQRAG